MRFSLELMLWLWLQVEPAFQQLWVSKLAGCSDGCGECLLQ
jgi:hypothetical protein